MPRRNQNAEQKRRNPYRPDAREALDRIEEKRARLGVTQAELAERVRLSERTLRRIVKQGRSFPRHLKALSFALRSIEREQEAEGKAL